MLSHLLVCLCPGRKVKEVTFINSLKDEERKAVLQQRLEEGAGGVGMLEYVVVSLTGSKA
jgi:predicted Fe-S protein YdhL (DUF1289 family)